MASKLVSFYDKRKVLLFKRCCSIVSQKSLSSSCSGESVEKETHTGQKWEESDYRLARFVNKSKQVNPNWAVKLIAEIPPIPVKGRVTSCDGGSGPTGHPKVYINLDKPGYHSCLYCGLRFYKDCE
ncbi:NADH-ubiquinone oxidoreductase 13 kDa-A subunit, putative [Pediculus humanus corporis]|uniref:NADH-ubiquinone oxidoreductase 13 kDa-A subunit, putative n=1 Tax=Pediculus humanus subsp. corporis TaxID=121224 RepID=E0VEN9_PEDHC|nr:NADH-ubiquinone oxidoreductase 13 kDa-A subunit, putative [Pediculus humanus corporis]EEB11845.1 NADH-ubiquinone oxidoreductase 13 kDa-A subunit, putative [Pediculus humanus corporis]